MNEQRRRELGIPVHAPEEHDWRADGYCNCGASKPSTRSQYKMIPVDGRTKGNTNLDVIEGNLSGDRG